MNKKRTLKVLFALLVFLTTNGLTNAQTMQVASGSFGILNPKLRLQYERGMGEKASIGIAMHYYMVNWTGPKFEAFGRLYGKKNGNKEGFFLQGKVGYGNLKSLLYQDYFELDSYYQSFYVEPKKRWSTIGAGVGTGYKFAVTDHFIIESILGVHFYSSPNADYEYTAAYNSADEFEQAAADAAALGEDIGWYLTTGLPLDFQIKFGYSF